MEPLLSPEEIEALRQTQDPDLVPTREVRPVDLIACDHRAFALMPELQATARRLAQRVEELFSRLLRIPCPAEERPVEIVPASQLADLWGQPRFVYSLTIDGQQRGAAIAIDGLLGGTYISRQFGGDVDLVSPGDRPATATERRTASRLAGLIMATLVDALAPIADVRAELRSDLSERPIGPAVVLLGLNLQIGEASGRLTIALATTCSCFEGRQLLPTSPRSTLDKPALLPALASVAVELRVALGERPISMRDVLTLKSGDLLTLDTPVEGDVCVRVAGRPKLQGKPLLQHGNLSVCISRTLKE